MLTDVFLIAVINKQLWEVFNKVFTTEMLDWWCLCPFLFLKNQIKPQHEIIKTYHFLCFNNAISSLQLVQLDSQFLQSHF